MKKTTRKKPYKTGISERGRGRPKEFDVQITLRLSIDELAAIAAAKREGEDRAEFIRAAIGREIQRRSK